MIKKVMVNSLLFLVAVGGASFGVQSAQADSTGKTNSTISFTSGGLNITDAPAEMDFGSHTLSGGHQSYDDKNKSAITVGDYRGQSSAGWQLNAKLENADFSGMSLMINPTGPEGSDYAIFTPQTLNGTEATVVAVTPDKVKDEKPDTVASLGAKIDIPANTPLSAQKYTNVIDWNLAAVPA